MLKKRRSESIKFRSVIQINMIRADTRLSLSSSSIIYYTSKYGIIYSYSHTILDRFLTQRTHSYTWFFFSDVSFAGSRGGKPKNLLFRCASSLMKRWFARSMFERELRVFFTWGFGMVVVVVVVWWSYGGSEKHRVRFPLDWVSLVLAIAVFTTHSNSITQRVCFLVTHCNSLDRSIASYDIIDREFIVFDFSFHIHIHRHISISLT